VEVSQTTGMPLMSREERRQVEERGMNAAARDPHRTVAPPRIKGETAEEKRARKGAVRDARVFSFPLLRSLLSQTFASVYAVRMSIKICESG